MSTNSQQADKTHSTTFWELLGAYNVFIPQIQRDYAQGRNSDHPKKVRAVFIDSLYRALNKQGEPLSLNFIYGTCRGEEGAPDRTFAPLDGQQRLTTLFLLHWYSAFRERRKDKAVMKRLKRFSYTIRPAAKQFCESLVDKMLDGETAETGSPSDIITDQSWFGASWSNDPTITGMLVMLDDIHKRFEAFDLWDKLTDAASCPITFHMMPLANLGMDENVYIKMNTRGRQLTDFEAFKASFLKTLHHEEDGIEELRVDFAHRIDGEWTDIFWDAFKHNDQSATESVDKPMSAYLCFVATMLNAAEKINKRFTLDEFTAEFIRKGNRLFPVQYGNLRVLVESLNIWTTKKPRLFFKELCAKVPLRDQDSESDLFITVCQKPNPSNQQQILLFAAILHLIGKKCLESTLSFDDFADRFRMCRNLSDHMRNRDENRPGWIQAIISLFMDDNFDTGNAFNQQQNDEECAKRKLLQANPNLKDMVHKLEDHPLLRGRLAIFSNDSDTISFDPSTVLNLGNTFLAIMDMTFLTDDDYRPALALAWLATGDYTLSLSAGRSLFAGKTLDAEEYSWRAILTSPFFNNKSLMPLQFSERIKPVTQEFLKSFTSSMHGKKDIEAQAKRIVDAKLAAMENENDYPWRYYFLKYSGMREDEPSVYCWFDDKCLHSLMLTKHFSTSWRRDPYLWTIYALVGGQDKHQDKLVEAEQWLGRSKAETPVMKIGEYCMLNHSEAGWVLSNIKLPKAKWESLRRKFGIDTNGLLKVGQDKDRIAIGKALIEGLLALA